MIESELLSAIAQVGFPIAVAIYLLYERTKFNQTITENLVKITETLERIEKDHDRTNRQC